MLLMVTFSSCTKKEDNTTEKYYLHFKANGEEKSYINVISDYNFIKLHNEHLLFYIRGHELLGVSNNNSVLSIQIDASITDDQDNLTGINIVAGTYTSNDDPSRYKLNCNYYPTGTDNYTIHNQNFTLKIEYLDKKITRGTFSGVLKNENGDIINITDGAFNIRVNYNEI
ncbi:MAG: hypothetical protein Q4C98_08575 [Capnocytophaga sp.]|nr:hypothetical protein [Capnocytophaga sp.]